LRVIASNCVEAIAPDMWRRGHHVEVTLPAEALWLHADGARLEQSISNLLINAAKYTPDGGDIAVIVERIGEQASVRVRDSGIGIAPEQLPKVFGMYVQVDAVAPRAEGGHGIGLAVVRTLIESHGGSVSASSLGLGLGSEFTVLLPVLWARPEVLTAAPGTC
jgi:signal transduction histidine kinase